jgi:hypothetical protein
MWRYKFAFVCSFLLAPEAVLAQQRTIPATVPRQIQFGGTLRDATGTLRSGAAALTFSLYREQDSRTPVWQETQNVQVDETGHYTVHLGATEVRGMPLELFTSAASLWLGVQAQEPGSVEQPRVLLVSVPYALKASDADTLGGLPAAAFVTRDSLSAAGGGTGEKLASAMSGNTRAVAAATSNVGGAGTPNYIPIWSDSATLGNSLLYQFGSNIGIGTTSPVAALQLVSPAAGTPALAVQAAGGQAASLQQWLDSGGTTLSSIDNNGNAFFPTGNFGVTLPAGAVVSAGQSVTDPAAAQVVGIQAAVSTAPTGGTSAPLYGAALTSVISGAVGTSGQASGLFAQGSSAVSSGGTVPALSGGLFVAANNGSGATTSLYGGSFTTLNQGGGTATNQYGGYFANSVSASSAVTNLFGSYVAAPSISGGGSAANAYGLYLENVAGATGTNFALYSAGGTSYFGGNVGIGIAAPAAQLEVAGAARFDGPVTFNASNSIATFTGNVGIGTSTAVSPLTVKGIITITNPSVPELHWGYSGQTNPYRSWWTAGIDQAATVPLRDFFISKGYTFGVIDAAISSGSNTLTSSQANFTAAALGFTVAGSGIPANTTITSVIDSSHATMSTTATTTATGVNVLFSKAGQSVNDTLYIAHNGFGQATWGINWPGAASDYAMTMRSDPNIVSQGNLHLRYNAGQTGNQISTDSAATADAFHVAADGSVRVRTTSATALQVTNVGGAPKFVVDSSAIKVGIGTSTPQGTLVIQPVTTSSGQTANGNANSIVIDGSANVGISVLSGSSSLGSLYFGDSNGPGEGRIQYNHATNTLAIFTNTNQRVTIDASGRVGIGTATPTLGPLQMASGAYVTSGGVWTNASDRNLKENFRLIDGDDILKKINKLPISEWDYKNEGPGIRHIGPMAQDFRQVFGLGNNDTSISTIDPAGISLLGIQALDKKVETLQAKVRETAACSITADSVGETVLTAGSNSIRVRFSQAYSEKPIVTANATGMAALADGFRYALTDIDSTGFTIRTAQPVTEDTTFNWHSASRPAGRQMSF